MSLLKDAEGIDVAQKQDKWEEHHVLGEKAKESKTPLLKSFNNFQLLKA